MNYPAPPVFQDPQGIVSPAPMVPAKSNPVGWIVWAALLGGAGFLLWRASKGDAGSEAEAKTIEAEIARLQREVVTRGFDGGSGRDPAPSVVVVNPPPVFAGAVGPPFFGMRGSYP